MLISADNHAFPGWAPNWLRQQVESPDCSQGTHPRLRQLAKWLTIYFADDPQNAQRWLYHAARACDRDVPDSEVDRLLIWAAGLFGKQGSTRADSHGTYTGRSPQAAAGRSPQADLEEIYHIAEKGPRLSEYRASSPVQLRGSRKTDQILDAWAQYCGETDPWICFGADDYFWTRRKSQLRGILYVHAQIVPSPMRAMTGMTQGGYPSEHSKDGTGERMFLVLEFDFTKLTPGGKPTIWVPLLERCEQAEITPLDIQAALLSYLATQRPLWMTVFSGSKSLQGWFPVRGQDERSLHAWFNTSARRLGACSSTWCVSQFVRMPDGTRAPNHEGQKVRQSIEFYNPSVL
jgi:hypothetical protein